MLRASLKRPSAVQLAAFERQSKSRLERASLVASDKAATIAKDGLRRSFLTAGAGRLGLALTAGSDGKKGRGVLKRGKGFTASGWVAIRSKSDRTRGAIEAYTEGADIRPVKGKWLWIATDAIPARVGKFAMTPDRYNSSGLVNSIGPLVFVPSRNGREALLVVKSVTVRAADGRRARRMPKRGGVRVGRQAVDEIVAFVGIRRTNRQSLVSIEQHMRAAQRAIPDILAKELS